jgi:dihydropteroate synthase
VYTFQPANLQQFWDIRKFFDLFFAYLHFFLYFCTVKEQIMAIGNVTPDSFYAGSRLMNGDARIDTSRVVAWAKQALADGADILDIGACSTRPGSTPASEQEEWRRLAPALEAIRTSIPDAQLSIDTFRPAVAKQAIDRFGSLIINDVSGGSKEMYDLVSQYGVPYIFTFASDYTRLSILSTRDTAHWILDPGFGFCGGVERDYECLRQMDALRIYNLPVLVGVSRKSMVYKHLGLTPETCLAPTQALQLYALEHGATILRTHDVKETAQTIKLFEGLKVV